MVMRQKKFDKVAARQRRAAMYDAVQRGELTLQNAVKEMRKISGMTQAEFAVHRGVSAKVIKEIERGVGNPTVASLNRIGQFFGLEVAFVRTEKLAQTHSSSPSEAAVRDLPYALAGRAFLTPLEETRQLMHELEDMKRLVSPLLADLRAVQTARDIVASVEEIQRKIQPPKELAKWLADIEAARTLLRLPASD